MGMMFCATCRTDLVCEKNGVGVIYHHNHVYPGDGFSCPMCGTKTVKTTGAACLDTDYKFFDYYVIDRKFADELAEAGELPEKLASLKRYPEDFYSDELNRSFS